MENKFSPSPLSTEPDSFPSEMPASTTEHPGSATTGAASHPPMATVHTSCITKTRFSHFMKKRQNSYSTSTYNSFKPSSNFYAQLAISA